MKNHPEGWFFIFAIDLRYRFFDTTTSEKKAAISNSGDCAIRGIFSNCSTRVSFPRPIRYELAQADSCRSPA
jgi:hypothetical protein